MKAGVAGGIDAIMKAIDSKPVGLGEKGCNKLWKMAGIGKNTQCPGTELTNAINRGN